MVDEVMLSFEASKYKKRKDDGQAFSNVMNAELNLMSSDNFSTEEMESLKSAFNVGESQIIEMAKDSIDTAFEKCQWFIEGGKWKSSSREIEKVEVSTFVSQSLIDRVRKGINDYITNSYR